MSGGCEKWVCIIPLCRGVLKAGVRLHRQNRQTSFLNESCLRVVVIVDLTLPPSALPGFGCWFWRSRAASVHTRVQREQGIIAECRGTEDVQLCPLPLPSTQQMLPQLTAG